VGVRARTPQGELEVRASLVIGADGRSSTIRERAGFEVIDFGAPIDVLWFRLSKCAGDPEFSLGNIGVGQFMVLIDRGEYWQCAYVIRKGTSEATRQRGMEAFREDITRCAPFLGDRVGELTSWDQVKLLTVKVDHLRRWSREGLLCIGDSAHAMSPVGGVGINLAIQDAVATANLLAGKLRDGTVTVGVAGCGVVRVLLRRARRGGVGRRCHRRSVRGGGEQRDRRCGYASRRSQWDPVHVVFLSEPVHGPVLEGGV